MNEYEALVREYRIRDLPKLTRRDEIIRDLPEPKRFNMYHVVVGMRRSGKSFYLFQMISDLHKAGVDPDRIFYFDFSDDRLEPMSPTCGSDVIEEYYRQVPAAREQGAYLFLDEVQELGEWQGLLRRLSQNERVTLTVTGSSSKLSAGELGTKSRGRAHSHVLYPLSFAEFCRFSGRDELAKGAAAGEAVSRAEQTLLVGLYDRYLVEGGFPGVFGMPSADRIEVLQGYVRDVVARDVAERHGKGDIALANQLARFALRNTGCDFSLNNLSETLSALGYKAYWGKLNDLSELMRQAYLFHVLPEFTMQLKPSSTAVPKVYAADPGLAYAVSRANQQDVGKRLETAVYLELARRLAGSRDETVASWSAPAPQREKVDFVVGDALALEPYRAYQVCADMSAARTRKRELRALGSAMNAGSLDTGTVITLDQEEELSIEEGTVLVIPAWRWSLAWTTELPL